MLAFKALPNCTYTKYAASMLAQYTYLYMYGAMSWV